MSLKFSSVYFWMFFDVRRVAVAAAALARFAALIADATVSSYLCSRTEAAIKEGRSNFRPCMLHGLQAL